MFPRDRGRSISISGSDIKWDEVDKRTDELGFGKMTSRYVQYAIKKDMKGKNRLRNRDIIMFGIILLTFLALLLNIIGAI
jgi:hypothetical protein